MSRPVLFGSRLCESLFDGATLPLLSIVPGILLWYAGRGFWEAAGGGIMFGILLSPVAGGLRIAVEVLILQKIARRRRGALGGLCAAACTPATMPSCRGFIGGNLRIPNVFPTLGPAEFFRASRRSVW